MLTAEALQKLQTLMTSPLPLWCLPTDAREVDQPQGRVAKFQLLLSPVMLSAVAACRGVVEAVVAGVGGVGVVQSMIGWLHLQVKLSHWRGMCDRVSTNVTWMMLKMLLMRRTMTHPCPLMMKTQTLRTGKMSAEP